MFVIQVRFLGSHGRLANQFFGGVSTGSGSPLWENLLVRAIKFPSADSAETCLRDRLHARKVGREYSVVALAEADETASRVGG